MTQEEAAEKLAAMVSAMEFQLSECEKFADLHGLTFSIDPAYGMGGYYVGKDSDDYKEYFDNDGYLDEDVYVLTDTGGFWCASSQSC